MFTLANNRPFSCFCFSLFTRTHFSSFVPFLTVGGNLLPPRRSYPILGVRVNVFSIFMLPPPPITFVMLLVHNYPSLRSSPRPPSNSLPSNLFPEPFLSHFRPSLDAQRQGGPPVRLLFVSDHMLFYVKAGGKSSFNMLLSP